MREYRKPPPLTFAPVITGFATLALAVPCSTLGEGVVGDGFTAIPTGEANPCANGGPPGENDREAGGGAALPYLIGPVYGDVGGCFCWGC